MRGYVGVTDDQWYRFLAARPGITEVNFWRPKDIRNFRVLSGGEPFFFKTHSPHNRIVGGGIFAAFELLPVSMAWDIYGEANGVSSLEEMRTLITRYRDEPIRPGDDPLIGCILVRDVTFFAEDTVMNPPPGFATSIMQGKGYELLNEPDVLYFTELLARVLRVETDTGEPWHRPGPVFGDPRLTRQRLGQRAFQAVVLKAYHARCAITGTKIWPALQAAHIRPVTKGGEHRLDNGLLLRSDVHTMFDRGYLAVDPSFKLRVSPSLRDEFGNGEQFYARAGEVIALPDRNVDRPQREFLEWHLDVIFKAS
jgi:putative restriction endonuclease